VSAFLLGIGFRADMGTCVRKLVLLKLIDACEDDGSRIFPATATVARAAQCSPRQVQRELKSFLDAGLIRLVRAGGKGPRSTNEYAMDIDMLHRIGREGWSAVCGDIGGKGDTVSPLEEDDKGDTGAIVRVTPETHKGDKLSHPTPPDSSIDPSPERGREREDQKSETERRREVAIWLKRHFTGWPGYAVQSESEAIRHAVALSAEERDAAVDRMADYLAAEKREKARCAYSVYLAEKRWERLPPKQPEPEKPAYAPAFGPVWGAIRMADLVTGPKAATPLKAWEVRAVEEGTIDRVRTERENRRRGGWPKVNAMDAAAETRGVGVTAPKPDEVALGALMEPVPVGSPLLAEWRAEFERQGWPWLPDPGRMPVIYFPAGGPATLGEFEAAVRGGHDGRRPEAAE